MDSLTLRHIITELKNNYMDKALNCLTGCGYFIASKLFVEIGQNLNNFHEQNPLIYYRNLIPENIMLVVDHSNRKFINLCDNNLLSLQSDTVVGSVMSCYIAPEVIKFRQFSKASDMFALGEIASELFAIDVDRLSLEGLMQEKYEHLVETIIALKCHFSFKRLTCSQLLQRISSFTVSYEEVMEDKAIKAIVSNIYTPISREDKFIYALVQAKSQQNRPTTAGLVCRSSDNNARVNIIRNLYSNTQAIRPSIGQNKEIMISYSRDDAIIYATHLKTELSQLGCNSFLDLEEVRAGNNFYDDLRQGIKNCTVFVAFITANYGHTLWTKRELQFADKLEKTIIPINFLNDWPPEPLDIILFATQYISSKSGIDANEREAAETNNSWNTTDIQRTAREIVNKYRSLIIHRNYACLDGTQRASHRIAANIDVNEKTYKLVISCHPNQLQFSKLISNELIKCGLVVWISTDALSSQSSGDHLKKIKDENKLKTRFRANVKQSSALIMILSEDYCESQTCKQQAFYCDSVISIIAINFDNYNIPYELSRMYDQNNLLSFSINNDQSFMSNLKDKISKMVSLSKCKSIFTDYETEMINSAQTLRKQMPTMFDANKILVYITASSESLDAREKSIHEAIGEQLSSITSLILIIGDYDDTENLIVNHFITKQQTDSNVYHLLPICLSATNSQTIYFGNTVKERDTVAAQLFEFCLLITNSFETFSIAEEFLWNDKCVIPVMVEERSGEKQSQILQKIKSKPLGVESEDWNVLSSERQTPETIANAVKNIILTLNN